ncbi:MAG: hypothetical protein AAF514_07510 [Verrucomicrobiota bacterium]
MMDRLRERQLVPEILDTLAPDDPAAVRSYRDLARINCLMGNHRFFLRTLRRHAQAGPWLEIGSGDGRLGQVLRRNLPAPDFSLTGFDLKPRGKFFPRDWSWQAGNLLEDLWPTSRHHMANLILHHFTDPELRSLRPRFQSARMLVFSEPARRRRHLWQMLLFRLLRPDPVTIHDADASIRAGFLPGELPSLLGLNTPEWTLTESLHPMGACRLVAVREEA